MSSKWSHIHRCHRRFIQAASALCNFPSFPCRFYPSFSMGPGAQITQAEGREQSMPFLLFLFCHRPMFTAANSATLPLPLPSLSHYSFSAQTSVPAQLSMPLSDWAVLPWTLGSQEMVLGFTRSPLPLSGIGVVWWAGLSPWRVKVPLVTPMFLKVEEALWFHVHLFGILEYKFHERKIFVCFIHYQIPNTHNYSWHWVNTQQIFVQWMNNYRKHLGGTDVNATFFSWWSGIFQGWWFPGR